MNLVVDYNELSDHFEIKVPSLTPIPAINEWPGWKRHVSGNYKARAWVSSILPMVKQNAITLHWSEPAVIKRNALLTRMSSAGAFLTSTGLGGRSAVPWPTERIPRDYQWRGICAMQAMDCRVLLEDEMGLGKTSTSLWAMDRMAVKRLLVICPVSAKYNWENEIKQTLGDRWSSIVVDGTPKQRASQLVEWKAYDPALKIAIIINYDLLRYLSDEQLVTLKLFAAGQGALCDESHYVKSRDSKRTKLVMEITKDARYVSCISGTPIRNMADDLFTQVEILRPGVWTSYSDFAKRHLVIQNIKFGKREVRKPVGTKNLAELNAIVNTFAIKRTKAEVSDIPPQVYSYPELQLEGDLRKVYDAMKDFAKIELQGLLDGPGDVPNQPLTIWNPRAKSAVEQAMRCEQVAQGFIGGIPEPLMQQITPFLNDAERIEGRPNELIFPSAPKLVWLIEAIEVVLGQSGAPIVFSRFNAPMFWLQSKLAAMGIKARFMHGGMAAFEKNQSVLDFAGKQFDVLLVQVKIAEAWNATRCRDVLFLGRDWSPAINAQAVGRAHREGQTGTVNVQIPLVRKTIEILIDRRLKAKNADATMALRNLTIAELLEAL